MDISKVENLFAANPAAASKARAPPTALSVTEKTPYYVLPGSQEEDTAVAWLLCLALLGTSKSGRVREWKSWVLSYLVGVAPHLASKLPNRAYPKQVLNDVQIKGMREMLNAIKALYATRDKEAITPGMKKICEEIAFEGLPSLLTGLPWERLSGDWDIKILLGHFSIVLFLIGKRVEGTDHSPITKARPEAVRNKAHLATVRALLDGPLRLSDESHNMINNAWAEMAVARSVAITEFATYSQSDTDFGQDIIYTTMHLLRWNGMQHARITMDFLNSYKWAPEVPQLRTFIAKYLDHMKTAARFDASIQPYLKVIFQDKVDIFPRKELEPLVGCALDMQESVSDTLKSFYRSSDYSSIIAAFREEAERRSSIRTKQLRAKEVQLDDFLDEEADDLPTPSS